MADGEKTYTQAEMDAKVDEIVKGLKAKNLELLGDVKALKEALDPLKGIDPEKARAALAAQEKAEAEKHKQAGDWEAREKALRDQLAKEHTSVVEPLKAKLAELESGLFKSVAERDALEAMGKPEIKGNSALLLPLIQSELKVMVVDGKQVTAVLGPDGKPRYRMTDNALLTVEDRLKELRAKPEYGGAFQGSGGSGTGAEGRGSASTTVIPADQLLDNLEGVASGKVTVAQS